MSTERLQQITTALGDRYRVLREIGRGGMATVYLAEDPRHRRQVAIKVFDPELAAVFDPELAAALGTDRFLREIEVTAGLSHPHILPLYDSGVAAGFLHYVMPYVAGSSLRELLKEKGRLPLDEALRIVTGVADALAFAHRKGIVHRDIKPENVLLQEGHALLADFGIARAAAVAGDLALTQTGMVIGTPAYMSPEQAVGDSALDARSDLYSLGCLLYECVSGQVPFGGDSPAEIVRRRLTGAAPRLSTTSSQVPAFVDSAVARALAREPADRFGTAEEFASALKPSAGAPSRDQGEAKGLVVLPFRNLSPDPENEFFADGLTEEVISDLSGIRALRVISRTSAMRFKGSAQDLGAVARELGVRYVMEGSVRRAGSSLRVTAQLIDAETDSHVWADKFSGTVEDVFAIQEEISRKIVEALRVQLTEAEERVVAQRPIDNAAAYDCFLQARHEIFISTPDALERAEKVADGGLALIGENPLLLATRGLVSWYYLNFSIKPEERYLDEAASFAARALEQDPDAYLAVFLRGLVAAKRGDLESALRDIRRASELRPGDAQVLGEWIRHLYTAGQQGTERARAVLEDALRADPLNTFNWAQAALWYLSAGRTEDAGRAVQRTVELSDRGNPVRSYAAYNLVQMGRREEAVRLFDEVASRRPGTPYAQLCAFLSAAVQGDRDLAAGCVTPLLEQAAHWVEYLGLMLAGGYAIIGRRDDAVRWLRESIDQGYLNYPVLAKQDVFMESLRGDVEYEGLMQDVERRWRAIEM